MRSFGPCARKCRRYDARMLRLVTAGESHGPALTALLEGMVAGVPVSEEDIRRDLARRRAGAGRGTRMNLEQDSLEIVGGIRHGRTLGSPVAIVIRNTEWPKWEHIMSPGAEGAQSDEPLLTRPRPGHADLAGIQKYGFDEVRPVLERASARETAARTAAGSVCKALLSEFGVTVRSHVRAIGGVAVTGDRIPSLDEVAAVDDSPLRCLDSEAERAMVETIEDARRRGDTLGGVVEVLAYGVPPGLGSHVHWEHRIDAALAQAMMSIPAIKGVEIGPAWSIAATPGSLAHDEIAYESGEYRRATDRAGGTEGGMTTGQVLWIRAAMKPLASLAHPLHSVDVRTKEQGPAITQRSDVCAVPAAGVVGEAMVAFVLARALLEKFGGDSLEETRRNHDAYVASLGR